MIWDMPEPDFDEVIRTHLKGTWDCMKAAIPALRISAGCDLCEQVPVGLAGVEQ
jgi:NAD(P)-dependent dehydrogenase (short-subunit alcohol dehydrogenase family)